MKNIPILIFGLLWFAIGTYGAVYLVMNNHPWFAAFILLITASLRVEWED